MLHVGRSSKASVKHRLSTHINIFPPTLSTHPGSLVSAAHCTSKQVIDVIYSTITIKMDRLMFLHRRQRKPRWSQCPNKNALRLIKQCACSYSVITQTHSNPPGDCIKSFTKQILAFCTILQHYLPYSHIQ